MQSPFAEVTQHHLVQPGLIDGHFAFLQTLDLFLIDVDTSHVNAHFGKTGAGNQSDISCPHNCNLHCLSFL